MADKKYEIDMVHGPIFPKIIQFAVPLMLSGVLQLFFNAADIIVVGRYSGKEALAAVGSTPALVNLLTSIFTGLSVAANVLVARYIGAKNDKGVEESVHTSILTGIICGTIIMLIGFFFAKPILLLMGAPADVLGKSTLYLRIYCLSMPAVSLYNFGSAILRAIGDTKRPLYYLTVAGAINVVCNLFFVIVLDMDVAGVAIATALSQIISAYLVLRCLCKSEGAYKLSFGKLKLHMDKFKEILRIGLPAGMQGIIFATSNVIVQSSVNSFGSVVMAGSAAGSSIEGFIWTSMNALFQANLSFTSQNVGAKKYSRINRITILTVSTVACWGFMLGTLANIFGPQLVSIYNTDPEVIAVGVMRLGIIGRLSFIVGIMETMVGSMRGLGYSLLPTFVSLTGVCLFRIVWIFTVFARFHTPQMLFIAYPISWTVAAISHIICFLVVRRKFPKEDED